MLKKIILLLFIIFSSPLWAVESAYVKVDKAIVYADGDLTTPIGFIRHGKTIFVGKTAQKNETIYTIILNGRIAFIKAQDIRLDNNATEGNAKLTEHDTMLLEKPKEDNPSLNNYVTFSLSRMSLGSEYQNLMQEMGDKNSNNSLSSYRILFEHRSREHKLGWSAGFDLGSKEETYLKWMDFGFEANVSYFLWKNNFLNLEFLLGAILLPIVKIQNRYALVQDSNATMWGMQTGPVVRLFPYSKLGLNVGLTFNYLKVNVAPIITAQESPYISDPVYSKSLGALKGINFSLGLSYRL